MPGEMPIPNLGLAFADATNIAAKSGAPVIFGGSNIGRGSAGGTSSTYSDTDAQSSNPDARSTVAPMSGGQGGASGGGNLLDSVIPAVISAGLGYGLNGGQVQSPQTQQALYGGAGPSTSTVVPTNAKASTAASFAPGPLAIGGLLLAAGVLFFVMRG